jgi:hypothetical protein
MDIYNQENLIALLFAKNSTLPILLFIESRRIQYYDEIQILKS